jgi:hypothetical protein
LILQKNKYQIKSILDRNIIFDVILNNSSINFFCSLLTKDKQDFLGLVGLVVSGWDLLVSISI